MNAIIDEIVDFVEELQLVDELPVSPKPRVGGVASDGRNRRDANRSDGDLPRLRREGDDEAHERQDRGERAEGADVEVAGPGERERGGRKQAQQRQNCTQRQSAIAIAHFDHMPPR